MLFGKSVIWKAVIVEPVTFFFLLIITSIQKTAERYKRDVQTTDKRTESQQKRGLSPTKNRKLTPAPPSRPTIQNTCKKPDLLPLVECHLLSLEND